jgi:hypothetical protein
LGERVENRGRAAGAERNRLKLGKTAPGLNFKRPALKRPLAESDPQRAPEQLGILELLPRPCIPVIEKNVGAKGT